MTTATSAVKGSASDEFPADFAIVHFTHQFTAPARSEALAEGNAVIAQLRVTAAHAGGGVREMKVRSLRVEEMFNFVGPDHVREKSGWTALVAGELLVEPGDVPEVVAAINEVGVSITHSSWHLDPDTEARPTCSAASGGGRRGRCRQRFCHGSWCDLREAQHSRGSGPPRCSVVAEHWPCVLRLDVRVGARDSHVTR